MTADSPADSASGRGPEPDRPTMDRQGDSIEPDSPSAGLDRPPAGIPSPPEPAAALFGDRIDLARRFADWLAGPAVERGLIGPREVPRLWDRHLLNCAAIAELIPTGALVADVGSGAGLPGLALAIARPDVHVVLIEPMARRTRFLEEVVADCGLEATVEVRRGRAEQVSGLEADVVTSRAVAPTDRLAAWSLPLLRPGGVMLAIKGRAAQAELEAARDALDRLGVGQAEVVTVGHLLEVPTTVVRIMLGPRKVSASRARRVASGGSGAAGAAKAGTRTEARATPTRTTPASSRRRSVRKPRRSS